MHQNENELSNNFHWLNIRFYQFQKLDSHTSDSQTMIDQNHN